MTRKEAEIFLDQLQHPINTLSTETLIQLEDALDYREDLLIEELLKRAEEKNPGITKKYLKTFDASSKTAPEEIWEEVIKTLS